MRRIGQHCGIWWFEQTLRHGSCIALKGGKVYDDEVDWRRMMLWMVAQMGDGLVLLVLMMVERMSLYE